MAIIQSLLDTDFYKLTMMQAVLHQFPAAMVTYRFKCRNEHVDLTPYIDEINAEIDALCRLKFSKVELAYCRQIRFFKSDFIDFLQLFSLNRDFIQVSVEKGVLAIDINGPWLHTILFEVPVLAIINEVYFKHQATRFDEALALERLTQKINLVNALTSEGETCFKFSDFGTRRRFSHAWQETIIQRLKAALPDHFTGTSNVFFAKRHQLTPIGTMAHEYLQACQALGPRLIYSQQFAFEKWAQEYRGELGIALSDVCGHAAFLRDFDLYFCKLFDGARHDSGDPFVWGDNMIQHYEKMRIDPRTKKLVFSDSLTFPLAIQLYERFKDKIQLAFGIGTNLTNDVGYEPLQIVIKMISCNQQPVAKVSDTPEKTMCPDPSYLAYLKKVFQIEQPPVVPSHAG